MKLLLDTHTFIWFLTGAPNLPNGLRGEIIHQDSEVAISVATLWEIGIKSSIGKLPLAHNVLGLEALCRQQTIDILPITAETIYQTTLLEWHHKDPFDRMLIATAIVNGYSLASNEALFDRYPVSRCWQS